MKLDLNSFIDAYGDQFPYSLDNRLIMEWYPQRVLQHAAGNSMLELGLGHGYTTQIFASHFRQHIVIEASSEIIRKFRQTCPDCASDIRQAYFEDFQFDGLVDNIVMGFILEHVDDPALILRRYRRWLAPGGSLFVAVPNYEALNKRFGNAAGLIADMATLSESDLQAGHQRLFSLSSLKQLVTEAGYGIQCTEGIFLKPITTAQIKQLQLSEAILNSMMMVGVDYPELCVGILMKLQPQLETPCAP